MLQNNLEANQAKIVGGLSSTPLNSIVDGTYLGTTQKRSASRSQSRETLRSGVDGLGPARSNTHQTYIFILTEKQLQYNHYLYDTLHDSDW